VIPRFIGVIIAPLVPLTYKLLKGFFKPKHMNDNTSSKTPSVKPQKRRQHARKGDIVLAAAEHAFVEFGYAGTSVDAIAEAAGVSKRTVYSNFTTKEALYAEVIKKRCAGVAPEIDPNAADEDPEETLLKASVAFLEAIYTPEQIALYQTIVADSRQFPDVGKMMFDGPVMRSQHMFDIYFRKQANKGLMRFPNLELAGAQFVALLKTNMHMRLMLNQPTPVSHKKLEEIARSSIHLFLHGALERGSPSDKSAKAARKTRPSK
jgi:TetR/AcrR family transcriptional repressor of mexJK operon